jgi:hypothetical protein
MIDFDLIAWDDEDNPRGNVQLVYEVLETEPVIVIRPITAYEPMPE